MRCLPTTVRPSSVVRPVICCTLTHFTFIIISRFIMRLINRRCSNDTLFGTPVGALFLLVHQVALFGTFDAVGTFGTPVAFGTLRIVSK